MTTLSSGDMTMPSPARERPPGLILMAAWIGVLTGFAEVCLLAVKKFLMHRLVPQGPDVAWMAPLSAVLMLGMLAVAFSLVRWRWPRLVTTKLVAFVFVFLGSLSPMLIVSWVNKYTALMLAAGIATLAARLIAGRPAGFDTLARRTLRWMAAIVVALAIAAQGWPRLAERRALAALPPASADAPNVLLIVLDTVRAQSLGLYGYGRPTTSQLERFAKTGVSFERAIATSPWTLPAHATMFTGRFGHEHSADALRMLDATYPTLAEVLSARGYLTAGFVANLFYCTRGSGLARGFIHYEDYPMSLGQIVLSSSLGRAVAGNNRLRRLVGYHELLNRKDAERVNRDFLRWLSRKGRRPFFAFLNYMDAHAPYLPPKPFDEMFSGRDARTKPFLGTADRFTIRYWSPSDVQAELDAYEGAIASLDQQLGHLFDELERRGTLENTLVVVTSDHGEEFYEHGLMSHGSSLYRPSLHIPLVISFPPHVPTGKVVRDPVTFRDLPATVVDLLKLEGDPALPGTSLARYWDGGRSTSGAPAEPAFSEARGKSWRPEWWPIHKGDMQSLVDSRYHYIRNGDGREELYDFENDPWEQHDLASSEKVAAVLARFRTSLQMILASSR
jgi:arylsulfatase A-like enzyme